jgi:hypothetical protein
LSDRKKVQNSFLERLAAPSATFAAIETDARQIWLINPNLSSFGNDSVTE